MKRNTNSSPKSKTISRGGKTGSTAKASKTGSVAKSKTPPQPQEASCQIGELDRYLFGEGRHYQIYQKLGAHPFTYQNQAGYHFAVWAPHAKAVSVVGDFNGWDPDANPM